MEVSIRNNGGESTQIIKIDFFHLLDENFKEVCKALANKVRILKEMKCHLDEGHLQIDNLIQIIRASLVPEEAVIRVNKEMGLSKEAAKYLMNMPLSTIISLSSKSLEHEMLEIRKQIDTIRSLCQP